MDISFCAGVRWNRNIYFSPYNMNALMRFDCSTGKVGFISFFSKEIVKGSLHSKAVLFRNEAWFVPFEGRHIACVNLETLRIEYYPVPEHKKNGFVDAILYKKHFLLLIPDGNDLKSLMRINMETHEIENCGNVLSEREICPGAYLWRDNLHILSANGEVVCVYDLKSEKMERTSKGGMEGYHSSVQNGADVWLIPWETTTILHLNLINKTKNEIDITNYNGDYDHGLIVGDKLLIFPFDLTRNILALSINKDQVEASLVPNIESGRRWLIMRAVSSDDEEQWITSSFGDIWTLDEFDRFVPRFRLHITKNEAEEILRSMMNDKTLAAFYVRGVYESTGICGLEEYLSVLCNMDGGENAS